MTGLLETPIFTNPILYYLICALCAVSMVLSCGFQRKYSGTIFQVAYNFNSVCAPTVFGVYWNTSMNSKSLKYSGKLLPKVTID